eukprot:jgi/Botrbrau1/12204/Bobra.0197s0001.2
MEDLKYVPEVLPSDLQATCLEASLVTNEPLVLRGLAAGWKARHLWTGREGLRYLRDLAGGNFVEAMLSESSLFKGDLQSRQSLAVPFSQLLDVAVQRLCSQAGTFEPLHGMREGEQGPGLQPEEEEEEEEVAGGGGDGRQMYLAQAGIWAREGGACPLAPLWPDLEVPPQIPLPDLAQVNLWLSTRTSRSSLHYDPHHNLLVVVGGGGKAVRLLSPASTRHLAPMPVWGESANHSPVDLLSPHPGVPLDPATLSACSAAQCAKLNEGDVLFIPEGWWHQVETSGVTIAVNFWFDSPFSRVMSASSAPHMAPYYARRIAQALGQGETAALLASLRASPLPASVDTCRTAGRTSDDHPVPPTGGETCQSAGNNGRVRGSSSITGSTCQLAGDEEHIQPSGDVRGCRAPPSGDPGSQALSSPISETAGASQRASPTGPSGDLREPAGENAHPASTPSRVTKRLRDGGAPDTRAGVACLGASMPVSGKKRRREGGVEPRGGGPEPNGDVTVEREMAMRIGEAVLSRLGQAGELPNGDGDGDDALGLHDAVSRAVMAASSAEVLCAAIRWLAAHTPRTLEALLVCCMCPATAEVLTAAFDERDAAMAARGLYNETQAFYSSLYGVVSEPARAAARMLKAKEDFRRWALCTALSSALGLLCSPLPQ